MQKSLISDTNHEKICLYQIFFVPLHANIFYILHITSYMKKFFLFLLVCFSSLSFVAKAGTPYIVEANSLNVRQSPSTDAAVIGKLTKGQEVNVLSIEKGWACITFNRRNGYISAQYIRKKSGSTAAATTKTTTTSSTSKSTTSKSTASAQKTFPYTEGDKARYGGWTETGAVFNNRGAGFNLDLVNGCYIRDYIFVGVGVGVRGYFSPAGVLISVPIYAQARGVLRVNRIVAPFVDLGIGGYAGFASNWGESRASGGGFYMRVAPGLRLGKHFHFSIGYERCGVNTGVVAIGADW